MKRLALTLAILGLACMSAQAASDASDSSDAPDSALVHRHRFIDMFKPIYLSTGIPLDSKPSAANSDVKFQLSLKATIVRDLWGKEFDFFAGYTQISVWNLYEHSSPFYDNTYIPGIYTSIPLRSRKSGEVNGQILFGYEHRSNGRDDIYSRSVNYGFCTYTAFLPHEVTLQATARIGDSWYGDTHGLLLYTRYLGFVQLSAAYATPKRNFDFMVSVAPVFSRSIANVTAEAGYRLGRRHNNPYLFVQYHYGYDEALRDCVCTEPDIMENDGYFYYNGSAPLLPRHMLRFGIIVTPPRGTRCML